MENKSVTCLGWIVVLIITVVVAAVVNGWVLSVLWAWFVVAVFDVPHLPIPAAIGITLIISQLTKRADNDKDSKSDKGSLASAIAAVFLMPLFILLVGWIVHLFM